MLVMVKMLSPIITQGLKEKFAPMGIQVLSIHPGPIKTDMADKAGFEESEPASSVSEAIVSALEAGDFHAFPDSLAQQFWGAYQGYSDAIIEAQPAHA